MATLDRVYNQIADIIDSLDESESAALLTAIDAQISLIRRAGVKPKGALKRRLAVYTAILELMEKQL